MSAKTRSLLVLESFLLVPLVAILVSGMAFNVNIGLRHILPIYPFVLMVGSKAVEALFTRRVAAAVVMPAVALFAGFELWKVAPNYLAFFNQAAGGPLRGHHFLVDSNLDWGQDLKRLKIWMDRNGVRHVNLSYFGTADPAYYGINCTHLPGAPFFAADRVTEPLLPGYVAISVTNLHGPYFNERARDFYRPLLEEETPDAIIGFSIYVYWVAHRWWY
jgi:hypothetical protein